ncbi:MAG: hypothetical protein SFW67_13780 [Myxococcaceae bacterium]|nr:hypothetical protein [Myxococcaceae bacterium]
MLSLRGLVLITAGLAFGVSAQPISDFELLPTRLPTPLMQFEATVVGSSLYLFGGCVDGDIDGTCRQRTADVWRALVFPDGGLGLFSRSTPLPEARARHGLVVVDSRTVLIVMGAAGVPVRYSDDVLRGTLLDDGGIGWQVNSLAPAPGVDDFGLATFGDTVFVTGGLPAPDAVTVWSKGLDASVRVHRNVLTPPVAFHQAFATASEVCVVGGFRTGEGFLDEVRCASWRDGGVGPFSPRPALRLPASTARLHVADSGLFVIGGADGMGVSRLDSDVGVFDGGAQVLWTTSGSPRLRQVRLRFALAMSGDGLYALGGHAGTLRTDGGEVPLDLIEFAPFARRSSDAGTDGGTDGGTTDGGLDAGSTPAVDAGLLPDAGDGGDDAGVDAGPLPDAGDGAADAGVDAGPLPDAGDAGGDGGPLPDGGHGGPGDGLADGGTTGEHSLDVGCGCHSTNVPIFLVIWVVVGALRRRDIRRGVA